MNKKANYGEAILQGFEYLLENYSEVFVIGQGLWSPWYVGNSMTDLDKKFGKKRIIDTPVSENACTGAAVGASLAGMKPIVVHPRMDFMLYAMDPIVNQAAKWAHMFGGQANPAVTFRAIINRGGEQGAQHSQALHSWFCHIPGLRVLMPSTVSDARDLLISAALSNDPVMYIDDRWLYDQEDFLEPVKEIPIKDIKPVLMNEGKDITIVGCSYSSYIALKSSKELEKVSINCDVIDLRTLNPMSNELILDSVRKTRRLVVVDNGWKNCGLGAEIISSVVESLPPNTLREKPVRISLEQCPAPTSKVLENIYYPNEKIIIKKIKKMF